MGLPISLSVSIIWVEEALSGGMNCPDNVQCEADEAQHDWREASMRVWDLPLVIIPPPINVNWGWVPSPSHLNFFRAEKGLGNTVDFDFSVGCGGWSREAIVMVFAVT